MRNVGLNPGADCRKELGVALVVDLGEGREALRVAMDFNEGEPIGFRLLDQRLNVFRIPVDAVRRPLEVFMRDQVDGLGDEAVTLRACRTPTCDEGDGLKAVAVQQMPLQFIVMVAGERERDPRDHLSSSSVRASSTRKM